MGTPARAAGAWRHPPVRSLTMSNFEFAQCACVLFDGVPTMEELEKVLVRWGPAGQPKLGEGEHGWALCGPGLTFALRSGAIAVVDIVDRPWPDDLAAAQTIPALGSAWRVGAFGAVATPGALGNTAPSSRLRHASVSPRVNTSTSQRSKTSRVAAR